MGQRITKYTLQQCFFVDDHGANSLFFLTVDLTVSFFPVAQCLNSVSGLLLTLLQTAVSKWRFEMPEQAGLLNTVSIGGLQMQAVGTKT